MALSWLKINRQKIDRDLRDIKDRRFISPALYILTQKVLKTLNECARGQLIDIGCGDMPYQNHIPPSVTRVDTLDREARTSGVTYIGDVTDMRMVKSETYDSAMCFEVLEHVPDPFAALREISRILKKDGILILSAPHMWPIHEAPHDYFRYTEYGLKHLLKENKFQVVSIERTGGVFSFLGHFLSIGTLCLFWGVPILKDLVFFLTKWLFVLPVAFVDNRLIKSSIAPLEYVCVARKL